VNQQNELNQTAPTTQNTQWHRNTTNFFQRLFAIIYSESYSVFNLKPGPLNPHASHICIAEGQQGTQHHILAVAFDWPS